MIYNINSCPDYMPERKAWSKEEDHILRVLKEERGEKKWSTIAKLMQSEFGVSGRTGKQCRERYHNHLDAAIVAGEWTLSEESVLFELHEAIGNKWSMIAQKLPGRSDNCVKNHFYSRLRKAVRRLNKFIAELQSLNEIRISLLYKIIQTTEEKFKNNSKVNEELVQQCNKIKNQLYKLDYDGEGVSEEERMGQLVQLMGRVEARFKKSSKKHKISIETAESRNDIPQLKQIQENMLKKEADEELSYYRIIKQVCQELVVSNYQ